MWVWGVRGAEEAERGVHKAIRKGNWGAEKKGVEVNYECNAKFLCYLGDTSKEIFEGQADKTFHIHWRNLEPIVDKYKENNFILIHFSQRYENSWLTEFFKEKNKTNVYPWIN